MPRRILSTYAAAFRGLPREVWVLAGVGLVNRCGSMVLPFLTLYLTTQRGYAESEAGMLLALYGVGAMAGIELGGRLVDRLGYRAVMAWSLAGNALGLFVLGALRDRLSIAVAAVALGLLAEGFRPANAMAFTVQSSDEDRARAFGLHRLAINVGWTIGPVLGGFLARYDYTWLFVVDGLSCLGAVVVLLRFVPAQPPPEPEEPEAEAPEAGGGARTPGPWRDGPFVAAFFLLFVQAAVFFQVQSTFPLYMRQVRGFDERVIGAMLAVNTVVIVLFEMVLVHRVQRRNPLRVVALAGLLVGVGFGLTGFATTVVAVVGTILIWTVGEMLAAPMMQTWVSRQGTPRSRGRYMAAFSLCFSAASVVAPAVGTLVYEHVGPAAVWHGCLVLGVVQWFGFRALARRGRAASR